MYALADIPLAATDLEDHPFTVASSTNLSLLVSSLQATGLLSPPYLRAKANGRWQVVAGRKRLKAAAALEWEATPAYILPLEAPDSRCLLIALHDNAFSRGFTLWEQIFYASWLCSFWDRQTVTQRYLPLLSLPPSSTYLDRLLAAASLEDPWQSLLAQNGLALTVAARLAAWPPSDRLAALPFFQTLPFSQSKQEHILEWLELLSRREGIGIPDILARTELTFLLTGQDLHRQERAAALHRRLQAWVFPRFSATKEAWETNLARLGLKQHPRLRLRPPPAFEGPDFHLEITFRDAAELAGLLEELHLLTQKKDFSAIMAL
jgi:ParB family chromosome partitioning protein